MAAPDQPNSTSNPIYPPAELGQSIWRTGVIYLELIHLVETTRDLTENLLRQVVAARAALGVCLDDDLNWWVSDSPPSFESTATSHIEAIYRRLERIARYAFHAGTRFNSGPEFPPPGKWNLDYELASALIRHRIEPINLSLAVAGLRREVVANLSRPACPLPWEPACVSRWRFEVYIDTLMAGPDCPWMLDRPALLRAIAAPTDARERPRLTADPDTRTVALDGKVIAENLSPDVFTYVSAVIAAHPHPIPFRVVQKGSGLKGKNQTRLRDKLKRESRRLASLVATASSGHFLKLPTRE